MILKTEYLFTDVLWNRIIFYDDLGYCLVAFISVSIKCKSNTKNHWFIDLTILVVVYWKSSFDRSEWLMFINLVDLGHWLLACIRCCNRCRAAKKRIVYAIFCLDTRKVMWPPIQSIHAFIEMQRVSLLKESLQTENLNISRSEIQNRSS